MKKAKLASLMGRKNFSRVDRERIKAFHIKVEEEEEEEEERWEIQAVPFLQNVSSLQKFPNGLL